MLGVRSASGSSGTRSGTGSAAEEGGHPGRDSLEKKNSMRGGFTGHITGLGVWSDELFGRADSQKFGEGRPADEAGGKHGPLLL